MVTVIKLSTIIAIIVLCVYLYPHLNHQNISAFVKENSTAAPLFFIAITGLRPILFFLPSMGLTIVAGVLFGTVWGTVYVVIGGALSTLVGFYFARWLGRDVVKRLMKKNSVTRMLDEQSRMYGNHAVLYMRLFNLPWDMVSYWAGLSDVCFRDFYRASLIPLVPVSFLYTYFGSHVLTPTSAGFIIPLSIMFVMGAVPYIRPKFKKKAHG
ncbi:MAG: TVP38/TMEM64 family protein [Candidatus Brocadia sp.]|nr:TVP38/TMEM64 family protein [Candidatus Brocadia sp.]